ncbi:hypothetical protein B296_00044839 [Ensete ventricosum]|uniref:Uncharacterized protein n=1 Tax=Ensete ventricosum TaxID=4639 RepID=A0A426YV92_ENSVE|nr:hypothetical protein B296_00044839 [Ensete ventricosum]
MSLTARAWLPTSKRCGRSLILGMALDGSVWWVPTLGAASLTEKAPSSTSAWRHSISSSSKVLLLELSNHVHHCFGIQRSFWKP